MTSRATLAPWIWASLLWLVTGGGAAAPVVRAAHDDWRDVTCGNGHYRYILFSPMRHAPVPAIVLLHGAGGEPRSMVDAWKDLAGREGVALIAPVLPMAAAFEAVAPPVFRCMVEDAGRSVALDPRRIYVFGHSMGGYLAYDAAMLQSRYFAAVAVHAMGIAPDWDWIVDSAARRTPVAIYIGDRDPLVGLENVRRTRDLLLARRFPVHYVELPNHDHDYWALSGTINADAWDFLKRQSLPERLH